MELPNGDVHVEPDPHSLTRSPMIEDGMGEGKSERGAPFRLAGLRSTTV